PRVAQPSQRAVGRSRLASAVQRRHGVRLGPGCGSKRKWFRVERAVAAGRIRGRISNVPMTAGRGGRKENGRLDSLPQFCSNPSDNNSFLQGTVSMAVTFETAAELVQRLGNIPLERIRFTPPPGTATKRDLLAAMRRSDRLYELVDGTLVEKAMGLSESMIAGQILRKI